MTGNDLITEALLLLRRITPGQTASNDEIATCQNELNALLGQWNAWGLAVYSVAPITIALTGANSYVVNPRAVRVTAWNARTTSGQATGGEPLDSVEFASVAVDRGATGVRIKALNYDAAFPSASVHVYPIASSGTLELWVWATLAAITNFSATIDTIYPPGYIQAIIFNLAVALAPKFATRAPLDTAVIRQAEECKAALVSSNANQHHTPAPAPSAPAAA